MWSHTRQLWKLETVVICEQSKNPHCCWLSSFILSIRPISKYFWDIASNFTCFTPWHDIQYHWRVKETGRNLIFIRYFYFYKIASMLQINIEYKEINGHELDCFVLKNYLHKQLILLSQHFFLFWITLTKKVTNTWLRTWVLFSTPMLRLTACLNCRFRRSDALFDPLGNCPCPWCTYTHSRKCICCLLNQNKDLYRKSGHSLGFLC